MGVHVGRSKPPMDPQYCTSKTLSILLCEVKTMETRSIRPLTCSKISLTRRNMRSRSNHALTGWKFIAWTSVS